MKINTIILILISMTFLRSETVRKFSDFRLEENDSLKADVKVFRGNAIIYGTLEGNLDVYSGDIKILNSGKITGTCKAYAGKVYKDHDVDESSSYYVVNELKNLVLGDDNFFGGKDKDKHGEIEIVIGGESLSKKIHSDNNEKQSFYFHNTAIKKEFFSYSSVEGAYLGLGGDVNLVNSKYADFNFYGSVGYGFKSKEWQYYTDEKLSFFNNIFSIGASQYSISASEDQWKISSSINTMSALFIHEDFYNYYLTEGFGFYTGAIYDLKTKKTETQFGLKLGYFEDNVSEMHRVNNYALFTNEKDFRQVSFYDGNLADEGTIKEMLYSGQVISKLSNLNTIADLSGTYERTLDNLEQDFEFQKLSMSLFFETKFTNILTFSNRIRLESCSYLDSDPTVEKTTPNFKYTTLGGNGTLPGYKFNEFYGNRALLNRSIIGFETFDVLDFRAIFDFGEAYEYDPNSSKENLLDGIDKFSTTSLKSSFGLGMALDDKFLFSIHKRLDTNKDPYQLQLSVIYNY
ncbi:MAG: hypothetical protein PF638_13590 [Candidatus Delongbacteria bacterium]|jgi:hypothetical protein|nr:hypothetical protein [Candidatus Delongbacteria bacterium]